jgi:hypothetical protein
MQDREQRSDEPALPVDSMRVALSPELTALRGRRPEPAPVAICSSALPAAGPVRAGRHGSGARPAARRLPLPTRPARPRADDPGLPERLRNAERVEVIAGEQKVVEVKAAAAR